MKAPTRYDPNSPNELHAPALPAAARVSVSRLTVLQPPLSRRGTGPGVILVQHGPDVLLSWAVHSAETSPLDPEPVQKWAEEGFAVAAITLPCGADSVDLNDEVIAAVAALRAHSSVTNKQSLGLLAYAPESPELINGLAFELKRRGVACAVGYGSVSTPQQESDLPIYIHMAKGADDATSAAVSSVSGTTVATYTDVQDCFFDRRARAYNAAASAIAHTRSLVFLRKYLGGPNFDLEAIWEEHTYWEFERRSVAHTMATMVAEPYVNHVPTMTGGMGREQLTAFYRDHFIFCNPPDVALNPISRTVGPDRVVDEFIFSCTHTSHMPWLLPNVPPTNAKLSIPMVAIVNIRGDRLYHEHIWWDQAGVLLQAGILPTHVDREDGSRLKLPVAGTAAARLLADERDGTSNEMINNTTDKQQR